MSTYKAKSPTDHSCRSANCYSCKICINYMVTQDNCGIGEPLDNRTKGYIYTGKECTKFSPKEEVKKMEVAKPINVPESLLRLIADIQSGKINAIVTEKGFEDIVTIKNEYMNFALINAKTLTISYTEDLCSE